MVTLSSIADAIAVIRQSSTSSRYGRPLARLPAQIARYSNSPVCLTTLITTIIPNSSRMTFQSMPVSALKNASWPVVAPIRNITAAPPRAARTRCTHSVAINT